MNSIIVTTDFSKEAENALDYAAQLAKLLGSEIILFNSFQIPPHAANSLLPAAAFQELIDHNNALLSKRAQEIMSLHGIKASYESNLLDFEDQLDLLMEKYNAKLVVMGMAPRSLEQDVFGNTTTSIMMKLKYSVLAVPYTSKFKGIKKILFACDYQKDEQIINRIKELAQGAGAEVEIFNVQKHPSDNEVDLSIIDQTLDNVPHYHKQVNAENIIAEIEKEVDRIDADLLIMIPKRYGFLKSMIHRSKTRVMASNNHVPLLSIPR